jgi:hypothetical protein
MQNTQLHEQLYKIEQKVYERCDKRNIHINNKSHMNNIASNNDTHTLLLRPLLHFTTLVDSSLPLD